MNITDVNIVALQEQLELCFCALSLKRLIYDTKKNKLADILKMYFTKHKSFHIQVQINSNHNFAAANLFINPLKKYIEPLTKLHSSENKID